MEEAKEQTKASAPDTADYDTPIDESQRKTGVPEDTAGKSSATPESGSSDTLVEGSPNQGTEKR